MNDNKLLRTKLREEEGPILIGLHLRDGGRRCWPWSTSASRRSPRCPARSPGEEREGGRDQTGVARQQSKVKQKTQSKVALKGKIVLLVVGAREESSGFPQPLEYTRP